MPITATLSPATLSAVPGKAVGGQVRVVNGGPTAETVELATMGPAAPWAVGGPPRLVLAPGAEGSARLVFTVPHVAPSTVGFTVRVTGTEVVEVAGSIEVAERHDVHLALRPLIARARRSSRHMVTVANHGNVSADVHLRATAAGAGTTVELTDDVVVVGPGLEATVELTVSARRLSFARHVRSHPLAVEATVDGAAPATAEPARVCAEAVFCQEPVRWRRPASSAGLALALVVVALAVWRPGARSGVDAGPTGASDPHPATVTVSNCPAPAADQSPLVVIATFAYCPASVTVVAGTEVGWTNDDAAQHTVTSTATPSGSPSFDSGMLMQGQSFATRFERPGTYEYVCTLHPGMQATVVVR